MCSLLCLDSLFCMHFELQSQDCMAAHELAICSCRFASSFTGVSLLPDASMTTAVLQISNVHNVAFVYSEITGMCEVPFCGLLA